MRLTIKTVLTAVMLAVVGATDLWAQHYLVFASDRHQNLSAVNSNTPVVYSAMGCWMDLPVEYVSLIGDMVGEKGGDAPAYDVNDVWKEVNALFPDLTSEQFSIIWADHDGGYTDQSELGVMKVPSTSTSDWGNKSTRIYTGPDNAYYIYAVNYYEMLNNSAAEPEAFKQWVDGIEDKSAPIIVLCHAPMHDKRKDNLNGVNWADALNYAATGSVNGTEVIRNVVFYHGHNHTSENKEYYYAPGSTVAMQGASQSEDKTIQFTYITAGYMKKPNGATTVNASLLTIDNDKLTFTKSKSGTTSVLGIVERVAQDDAIYYDVTFESNGGSEVESQRVKEGQTVTEPTAPTREGYIFSGWYADEDLTTEYDFTQPVSAIATLYAKWAEDTTVYYTVTFETDGGSEVDAQRIAEGMTASEPSAPIKSGFTFEGWYADEELNTAYDFSTPVTANLTIYAKWTEKEVTGMTFAYSSAVTEGEAYVIVSNGYAMVNNTGTIGAVAVTMDGDNVAIEDENVDESNLLWTVGSDGSLQNGGYYVRRASGNTAAALTLNTSVTNKYTNWNYTGEQLTVVGGQSSTTTYYIYYDNGWYTNTSTSFTTKLYSKVETPVVVYHTVTFVTNGGSEVAGIEVEDGAYATEPVAPTLNGFTFAGWYSDEALITEFDFSQPVTADITLYAKWDAVMAACATPTLEYQGGKVVCSCATEGVTYRYKVELTNTEGETTDGVITIGPAVTVTVRATREGMLDSEPAAMMFSLPQVGDVNGDGSITIADVTALVDIILGK